MRRFSMLMAIGLTTMSAVAQETFPINGVKDDPNTPHLLKNGVIHVSADVTHTSGYIVIQDGRIRSVGAGQAPEMQGAVVHDLNGKHVYPSFIDPYSTYGVKQPEKKKKEKPGPQYDGEKSGAYAWNDALNPEVSAAKLFNPDEKKAEELRKAGFGATISLVDDGIAKGTSACVLLGDGPPQENLVNTRVAANYSFKKGTSHQNYPNSLMGSIALLRQTYMDAEWYAGNTDPLTETNLGLDAWGDNQELPQVFSVTDLLSTFRADLVGDEFDTQYIFVGTGSEYRRVDEIKATRGKFIIPMKFPEAYDVTDPYDALLVDYADMLHWELAPHNARMLEEADIEFALTAHGLEKPIDVWGALEKMVEAGLDTNKAVAAFTSAPAKMFGLKELGTLNQGMIANLLITSDGLLRKKSELLENWVAGDRLIIKKKNDDELDGKYDLSIGSRTLKAELTGTMDEAKGKVLGTDTVDLTIGIAEQLVSITFKPKKHGKAVRLTGRRTENGFKGEGQDTSGTWLSWSMKRTGDLEKKEENGEKEKKEKGAKRDSVIGDVPYPFLGYGNLEIPKAETVLIKNATVWTNEEEGIIEGADVLIANGKIEAVGKGLSAGGAKEIDGTGKHVTAGIMDEHSHIAISRGVNEGTQAVTAEVCIGDVVNSEDINIYRQLAGGVTCSQLLHGSANPIGGQSGIVKLRWGQIPEQMKVKDAAGHIKFALGENVKQSNWGDYNTIRYPQTRMGVEQVFYDAFHRAKAYKKEWAAYNSSKKKSVAPRRDIELDILVEILDGKRFVTCHSYVQSEINMLMHVADSMGWKMNTFTHILEGYKVADKMKEHGVSGSTFSDWWAYKFEVNDAIPYNAAIMHSQGVNVGINSDDAEMGRRLNQEAAKGVKYGGMSEEEAWKMVTLNPAKMLKLDKQTGSLKPGKDADVVVWSDNPLTVYAKAEKTFVDGVCYFDVDEDLKKREMLQAERNRLIQKMLAAKKGGEKTQKPKKKEHRHYHCDTLEP